MDLIEALESKRVITHSYNSWDYNNPICIYNREIIHDKESFEVSVEATCVINVDGKNINVGDILYSNYLGSTATFHSRSNYWILTEILARFTPKGDYKVDITDSGLVGIFKPFKEDYND